MTPVDDIRELLPLYALGILDPEENRTVERAISTDPLLAAELVAYQDSASLLVAPVVPAPDVKVRLLASVGGGPLEKFAHRLGSLFDVTVEKARELLGLIERPASWEPQIPGLALVHFGGGPAYAAADCGFVRLAPGAVFPPHTHLGDEACVILQGRLRDATNDRVLAAGDEYFQSTGSEHYLINDGSEDCIFAARAMHGIAVAGVPARPNKPPAD
ncbi:MAG TPA: cupin domain-containing protein [Kofleriaceae bacterium]|nr:cupin domain-containing protein [Kofleriaceae bacterium]